MTRRRLPDRRAAETFEVEVAGRDREWWAAESERLGTDWKGLGEVAAAVLLELALMPCPTCGRAPCQTPPFCEQCRRADAQERTAAMPETFDNTNRGVLFNERDRKTKDTDRDYGGNINIEGREFWLSAWVKTSKKGTMFLSLSIRPKEVESRAAPVNDSIPF